MVALSEQQIMTCCACRSFASTLAAMIAHAESSEGVIAVARDIWWKQVRPLDLRSLHSAPLSVAAQRSPCTAEAARCHSHCLRRGALQHRICI